jgi:hypothetical protein
VATVAEKLGDATLFQFSILAVYCHSLCEKRGAFLFLKQGRGIVVAGLARSVELQPPLPQVLG